MIISNFQSILIFLLIVIFLLRNRITKIWLNHYVFGEWIIEADNEKHIPSQGTRKLLKHLPDTQLWALLDFKKQNASLKRKGSDGFYIEQLNLLQKILYKNMMKTGLVRKENDQIAITEKGKEIVDLMESIQI